MKNKRIFLSLQKMGAKKYEIWLSIHLKWIC